MSRDYHKAFIVNDMQYPFTDWALWKTVCEVARDEDPDEIIAGGDCLDFAMLSSFTSNPHAEEMLGESVNSFHKEILAPLLSNTNATKLTWLHGNHEDRINKYITEKAPALADAVDMDTLIGLQGWDTYPYKRGIGYELADKLMVTHGWAALKHSGVTARQHVQQAGMSVLHGHTHRCGVYQATTAAGTLWGAEMGHMCNADLCPGQEGAKPDWQPTVGHTVLVNRQDRSLWTLVPTWVFGPRGNRRAIVNDREYRVD